MSTAIEEDVVYCWQHITDNMLNTFKKIIFIIFIVPAGLLLILIALPLAILAGIVEAIQKPSGMKALRREVASIWIPDKKYLYIYYDNQDTQAVLIKEALQERYGTYAVFESWPSEDNSTSGYSEGGNSIVRFIMSHDDEAKIALVSISPGIKFQCREEIRNKDHTLDTEGTQESFMRESEKCVTSWAKHQILMLADKDDAGFHPTQFIDGRFEDFIGGFEHGDVAGGELQVWEYPSGKIFDVRPDREVNEDNFYSTSHAIKGVMWLPTREYVGRNKKVVEEAYIKLSKKGY